jgi:putative acetyltransferase
MPEFPPHTEPAGAAARVAGLTIRAREPGDWSEIADLMELPKIRWGTLRLPYTRKDQWRKMMENPPDTMTGLVAVLDGRIVANAGLSRSTGRRSHVADIGMSVHDDFQGGGIGSSVLAALIDVADNWLNLRRLELAVYVDNEPALRLYRKFGFEIEGTRRGDVFRDGKFVDSFAMARWRDGGSSP